MALYLDLLEASLTGTLDEDGTISPWTTGYDRTVRALGRDWPATAATMIGTSRMRNLRLLVERALAEGIPGDLIETGVWRGGACIYMRGILAAHGDAMRRVFVADSFHGLPPPDPTTYPADTDDKHHTVAELAVPRYGSRGQLPTLWVARRTGSFPGRMVSRYAPGRTDRSPRGVTPRRRYVREHHAGARCAV